MAKLKITLVRSPIGSPEPQRVTVKSLGLRKMHQSVMREDNPTVRGMIHSVRHLVQVEEIEQ